MMISVRTFRRGFRTHFFNTVVPDHVEPDQHAIRALFFQLQDINGRYLIMTGAGVSTESGIPDYRSEKVGRFARSSVRPIQYHQVTKSSLVRQRFWARNYVAYPTFAEFQPNASHQLIADWERQNRFYWLLTQNVDGLHQAAGSKRMTEMHGTMHVVRCLKCSWRSSRVDFQGYLEQLNPDYWNDVHPTAIAPDGDVDLPDSKIRDFKPPSCPDCDHEVVLPDVIFFGDNIPVQRRMELDEKIDLADGLLILGSTVSVRSACQVVERMHERKRFIGIVNIGNTFVDHLASLRITRSTCSEVLTGVEKLFKNEKKEVLLPQYGLRPRYVSEQANIPSTLQIAERSRDCSGEK